MRKQRMLKGNMVILIICIALLSSSLIACTSPLFSDVTPEPTVSPNPAQVVQPENSAFDTTDCITTTRVSWHINAEGIDRAVETFTNCNEKPEGAAASNSAQLGSECSALTHDFNGLWEEEILAETLIRGFAAREGLPDNEINTITVELNWVQQYEDWFLVAASFNRQSEMEIALLERIERDYDYVGLVWSGPVHNNSQLEQALSESYPDVPLILVRCLP